MHFELLAPGILGHDIYRLEYYSEISTVLIFGGVKTVGKEQGVENVGPEWPYIQVLAVMSNILAAFSSRWLPQHKPYNVDNL